MLALGGSLFFFLTRVANDTLTSTGQYRGHMAYFGRVIELFQSELILWFLLNELISWAGGIYVCHSNQAYGLGTSTTSSTGSEVFS